MTPNANANATTLAGAPAWPTLAGGAGDRPTLKFYTADLRNPRRPMTRYQCSRLRHAASPRVRFLLSKRGARQPS
jgi:hypothetical protein